MRALLIILSILLLASPAGADDAADAKCVKIPKRKGEVYSYGDSLATPKARWTVKTETLTGLDFDGNNTPVVRVPELKQLSALKETTSLSWSLYLVRDGCAIPIGRYRGVARPHLLKTSTHGMRDFTIWRSDSHDNEMCRKYGDGCSLLTRYTFNGTRYVAGKPRRR